MTDSAAENVNLDTAPSLIAAMREQIAQAVVGQQDVVDALLVALFGGGHVLIEGVPGLGKTLLVKALARTFSGAFGRIQFTPDLLPADVTGHVMYDNKTATFRIRRGPVFTHLLLADEINRAPAKTQAALLEVMQERQVTIEGRSLPLEAPFMTLATQNPVELEGTFPLPEAQLDRFLLKVLIDYPQEAEERMLVQRVTDHLIGDVPDVSRVTPVVDASTIVAIQGLVAGLTLDAALYDYIVRIVRATREWPGVAVGAGPRGGIAIVRAARALALMRGRDHAIPDDVKTMALPCLRHRIILAPELEIEGTGADTLLEALLDTIDAPRR